LCNSVRWIPNCQRNQCSENGDALPHDSLLSATPLSSWYYSGTRRPQGFHRKLVNAIGLRNPPKPPSAPL
jgi:hypothetical protein